MKSQNIKQEWDKFQAEVIPSNAPKVQVQEMRRAFYSGATSAFYLITDLGENKTEEEAVAELSKLETELGNFFSKVGKGF